MVVSVDYDILLSCGVTRGKTDLSSFDGCYSDKGPPGKAFYSQVFVIVFLTTTVFVSSILSFLDYFRSKMGYPLLSYLVSAY